MNKENKAILRDIKNALEQPKKNILFVDDKHMPELERSEICKIHAMISQAYYELKILIEKSKSS